MRERAKIGRWMDQRDSILSMPMPIPMPRYAYTYD